MSEPRSAGTYVLVPATSIDETRLAAFSAAVWPGRSPDRILGAWWRRAAPDSAVAAVHQASGDMIALCAGRHSEWVIGSRRHPAVALCDWYVAPGHVGRMLGRRLVRHFDTADRLMYGFSMSEDSVAYVARMGWTGPYTADFLVLALPFIAVLAHRVGAGHAAIEWQDHLVTGSVPPELARDLNRIEAARAQNAAAHMWRGASEWSWRLSIRSERRYNLCVVRSHGEPVGYIAVRRLAAGSSRALGPLPAAIVSDFVAANDDPALLAALAAQAARLASALGTMLALAATSTESHARALAAAGFLSPATPLLGRLFRQRSPQFMWLPRGPGAGLAADRMALTFLDADVDLVL